MSSKVGSSPFPMCSAAFWAREARPARVLLTQNRRKEDNLGWVFDSDRKERQSNLRV